MRQKFLLLLVISPLLGGARANADSCPDLAGRWHWTRNIKIPGAPISGEMTIKQKVVDGVFHYDFDSDFPVIVDGKWHQNGRLYIRATCPNSGLLQYRVSLSPDDPESNYEDVFHFGFATDPKILITHGMFRNTVDQWAFFSTKQESGLGMEFRKLPESVQPPFLPGSFKP